MALDAVALIGTHSAEIIIGTGRSPEKDAGDMECIRIRQLKKTLTPEAGLDMRGSKSWRMVIIRSPLISWTGLGNDWENG
jgi:hypothetical protein